MARKTWLVLLGIFIIILGGVLIYLIFKNFGGDVGNILGLQKGSENEGIGDREGEGSGASSGGESGSGAEAGENKKSFGGGGGAGGGSGGSGSSAVPETANCYNIQVPYALKNFEESFVCNDFQDGVCINKNLNCSLEVYNLDGEASGSFVLQFILFEKGTYNQLDSALKESFLEPGNFEKIEVAFNLQSEGAEGSANKEGECRFFTESVPTKEFCR